MPEGPPDFKELRYYYSLAQVGLEMVVPLGVGVVLDHSFGWTPWATIVGFVFGFVGGFAHLMVLVNRQNPADRSEPDGEGQ